MRRLDIFSGPSGCPLLPNFSASREQEVPLFCVEGTSLPVHGGLFWIVDSTTSVYEGDGSNFSGFTCRRDLSFLLLGQFVSVGIIQGGGNEVKKLVDLCKNLSVIINQQNFNLNIQQVVMYPGTEIHSSVSKVFLTQKRIDNLLEIELFCSQHSPGKEVVNSAMGPVVNVTFTSKWLSQDAQLTVATAKFLGQEKYGQGSPYASISKDSNIFSGGPT